MVENFREAAFQLSSLPADDPSSPTEIEIDDESSKLSLSVSITDAVLEQELRFEEEQNLLDSAAYEYFVQGNGYFQLQTLLGGDA